jgi:predicted site-specific integrase-resolvase
MNEEKKYVPSREASKIIGVHPATLRKWHKSGKIDVLLTEAGQRLYNVDKFIGISDESNSRKKICYCRVSSKKQKNDLQNQIQYLQSKYPAHTIVTDIGSGINWNRKGLQNILELVFANNVSEIVVAHKDRLCRFAFDLLEWIFVQHGVKVIVCDQENHSPESELSEDLMSIIHIFSCKQNGKRRYKNKDKENKTISK